MSALRYAPISSGVEPTITMPSCSSRATTAGSFRTVAVSAEIFLTMAGDVLAGRKNANHDDES